MKNLKTQFLQTSKIVILALVLAFGLQYASAATWVAPTSAPPGGNTAAPINVGGSAQEKTGGLIVGSGSGVSLGLLVKNGLTVTTGDIRLGDGTGNLSIKTNGGANTQPGAVLTLGPAPYYSAYWGNPPSGGGGGSYNAGNGLNLNNNVFSINAQSCGANQYSKWTGTAWTCATDQTSGGGGGVTFGGVTETPLSTGINKTSVPYTTDLDCPAGSFMTGWTYDNQGTSQGGHGKVKVRCRSIQ